MQNFIRLQAILLDPKKDFQQFKTELQKSQITQATHLCLFLNMAASIKRPTFDFPSYMDLLLNFGKLEGRRSANINYTGYKDKISILMTACEKSSASTVRCLVSHPQIKIHIKDPNQMNALFYAIKNSDQTQGLKMIDIFTEVSNQMIDSFIKNNYSPLFFAVERFKLKIVQSLLKNGADPNQKLISSGNTPLHQFIKISTKYNFQQAKKLFEIFFRYGFNIQMKNNQNQSIIQYAQEMRFNIAELITEISKKIYNLEAYGLSQESETQEISQKKCSTTKLGDTAINDNFSQFLSRQQSDICIKSDFQSRSIKSQLSQNNQFHFNSKQIMEKQFSYDMSQNFSPSYQIQEQIKFIEYYTTQEFQNCLDQKQLSQNKSEKYIRSQPSHSDAENQSQSEDLQSTESDEQFLKANQIDYQRLHKELIEFNQISQEIYMSAWRQIEPFLNKLSQLADLYNLKLQLIGSFATGLWTYLSDIDIALVAMNDYFVDFQKILEKIFNRLKTNMYKFGIKQISINKYSKIVSIKIQMDQYLYSSRKVDIYVFHRKNTGKAYVNYINQALRFYPQISPIFFTIKRVCQQFKLHDPAQGGLKAYTLFLMIYSIIQTLQTKNMGQILYQICYYYGFYFQYDYDLESINEKGLQQWHLKVKLNIGDPLNSKNNMGGKNTDGAKVQKMFRTIYYSLHKNIKQGTALQYILQLAQIL